MKATFTPLVDPTEQLLADELQRAEMDRRRHESQPDWLAMQRSISAQILLLPTPRTHWWRRWLLPTSAVVTVAAVAAIWLYAGNDTSMNSDGASVAVAPQTPFDASMAIAIAIADTPDAAVTEQPAPLPSDDDGFLGDDDDSDDDDAAILQRPDVMSEFNVDAGVTVDIDIAQDVTLGPDGGLHWVDKMDDQQLDDVEQWLSQELAKRNPKKG